jgi:Spy/CpxP family protein refolding chaperone
MIKTKTGLMCAALAAMLALSVGAMAQARQRGQGRRGGRMTAVQIPVAALDAALKLTDDQKKKITAIQEKFAADSKPLRPMPGGQADPANRQKLGELRTAANGEIEAVLTAEQKTKLPEVVQEISGLQQVGIPTGVIGELKLTADQKTKIAEIAKAAAEQLRGLSQEDRQTKGREIRTDASTKVQAILTADQKTAIEKWNKEHPRPGRNRN